MHKVFGEIRNVKYTDRPGAYVIPIRGDDIGVVKTSKGYFLLGGGIEEGETDEMCIIRECLEETGYDVKVMDFICSAETYGYHYSNHPSIENFHPIQAYYLGEILEKKQNPIEEDHYFKWVNYETIRGNLFVEMQNWALNQCWNTRIVDKNRRE